MGRWAFAIPSGIVAGSLLAIWIDGLTKIAFTFVIVFCIAVANAIAHLFPVSKK